MPLANLPDSMEYAFQRPYFLIVQPAALAAGTNDVIILTIPLNEIWELHGASISTVAGGATATASLSVAFTGSSFDTQVLLGPQTLSVLNAQRDLLAGKAAGIILPPGSDVRLHIEAAILNDVVAARLLIYKFPRAYFFKPVG